MIACVAFTAGAVAASTRMAQLAEEDAAVWDARKYPVFSFNREFEARAADMVSRLLRTFRQITSSK
jgi:hypothetical protein